MSDLVTAMWGIALLVALVGCIPYGIWIIYTAFKKRWKRVGIQIAVPVLVFLVLWAILSVLSTKAYSEYLSNLYDADVKLGAALYEYDSPRAFNGDGYSFSVYELPANIRSRFETADKRLLSEFPKRPSYRNHWSPQHWREAPFDPKFEKYLDFALSRYDSVQAPKLSSHFKAIREALSHKRTYYAFFAYEHGDYPGDIDLFIVDLEGGRLYTINHNS
jgi:hypothetical protein